MKEHLRYIRNPHQYGEPKRRHFNLPGHNINDFQCRIIHKMGNTPKRYDHKRTEKEEFYISALSFAVVTTYKMHMLSDHDNINNWTHVKQKYICLFQYKSIKYLAYEKSTLYIS